MKTRTLIIVSIALFSLSDLAYGQYCTSNDRFTEIEYFADNEIDTIIDIQYGFASNHIGITDTVLLDAFFPNNTIDTMNARPAVVMIHGGGFSGGQKEDRWGECFELAKRGFVTFSISYRLGWDQTDSTAQLKAMYRAHQDAHAAIRYIVNNASTFGVDTNWIFAGGTSAGANTANNLVYTHQSDYETKFPGISTLLGDLNTSTNSLTNTFTLKAVFNNWGSVFIDDIDSGELVPQVAFHGDADTVVSIDTASNGIRMGSRAIHNYLVSNDICSDITVKPGGGHGIYGDANGTTFRAARTSCFFKSIFCNSCTDHYATSMVLPDCSTTLSNDELSIDEHSFRAYPNPAKDILMIDGVEGNFELILIDITGKTISENEMIDGESTLNVSVLNKGVYILQIGNKATGKTEQIKFVKE